MINLRSLSKKKLLNITLGLGVAFSAAIGVTPSQVYAASTTTSSSNSIISFGEKYMGTPYQYGATSGNPQSFDCSSFVQYVFNENGISLPRDSRQQSNTGTYVARNDLQPGDLIFFYSPIHHVAIYIGNGQILHTYGKPGVTISNLNSGWWSSHYTTARRVIPTSSSTVGQAPTSQPVSSTQPVPSKQANANTGTSNHFTLVANAGKELNNVESLLKQNGYNTYTNPTDWFKLGQTISSSNVKKGDVLFFSTTGDKSTIEHVGVYLGSGNVLVKSGTSSKTYSLSSKVVQNAFVIAKRYN